MPLASIIQPLTRFLLELSLVTIVTIALIHFHKSFDYMFVLLTAFNIHIFFWFILGHGLHFIHSMLNMKTFVNKKLIFIYELKERCMKVGKSRDMVILLYGGITRGSFDDYSDIDVFVFTSSTSISRKVEIYFMIVVYEKLRSVVKGILLDIDLVENVEYLKTRVRMRKEKFFLVLTGDADVLNYLKSEAIPLAEYKV